MNVFITGVNKGIGLALALKYADEGANVIGVCRQASPELKDSEVEYWEGFHLTKDDAYENFEKVLKGRKLDIVINNAGILRNESFDSLGKASFHSIREQLEVNSLTPLRVIHALAPHLKNPAKVGIITSRMGSIEDNTSGGMYGYRMSKAAANMAGVSLAHDLKDRNVSVALLHPGYVRTDMTNNNGNIDPKESAEGLYNVMKNLTIETTGKFWHTNGEILPW